MIFFFLSLAKVKMMFYFRLFLFALYLMLFCILMLTSGVDVDFICKMSHVTCYASRVFGVYHIVREQVIFDQSPWTR